MATSPGRSSGHLEPSSSNRKQWLAIGGIALVVIAAIVLLVVFAGGTGGGGGY